MTQSPANLTRREAEVLASLKRGASNKEIAAALSCAVKTVEFHMTNLMRKFSTSSRLELVLKALLSPAAALPGLGEEPSSELTEHE